MTITERSMKTRRGEMSWLEAGAGWPVFLLHAFPFNAMMWQPQLERVPDSSRFVAPYLRGFGRSAGEPREGGPVTMDDYADDVFALMDGLEIDAAVIGGLSMGGYVSLAMYRRAPARFTGMILADTRSQADTPQGREGRTAMRTLLASEGPAGVAHLMLPKLFSAHADPEVVEQARRTIECGSPQAIDAAIAAMMDRPDSTPDLPSISCASLVLVGEEDAITPVSDAKAMQRALARSTLTVIPGAGHMSNLEQPDRFSRAVADFLVAHL